MGTMNVCGCLKYIDRIQKRLNMQKHALMMPELEDCSISLKKEMKKLGYVVEVFQGYRSIAEQDILYNQGRTTGGKIVTKAKGGQSWHNFGCAFDMVFRPYGKWSWDEIHPWAELGRIGKGLGLEWGGDWVSFKDRPHFQIVRGLTLSEASKINKEHGLAEVWKTILKN